MLLTGLSDTSTGRTLKRTPLQGPAFFCVQDNSPRTNPDRAPTVTSMDVHLPTPPPTAPHTAQPTVPGTALAGFLVWHHIDAAGLLRAQLEEILHRCGVVWRGIPDRSETAAFKSATNPDKTRRSHGGMTGPDGQPCSVTYRIRPHVTTARTIERRIERYYWSATMTSTPPQTVARYVYYKTKTDRAKYGGGATRLIANHHLLNSVEARHLRDFATDMDADMHARQYTVDTATLRSMMTDLYTYEADGITLNAAGLWFLPAHAEPVLRRLIAVADMIGGESYVHAVPVSDTGRERAMLAKSATATIRARASRVMMSLREQAVHHGDLGQPVPAWRARQIRARYDHVVRLASLYGQILGDLPTPVWVIVEEMASLWEATDLAPWDEDPPAEPVAGPVESGTAA